MRSRALALLGVLSVAGCAAVNPRAGLGDIERLVSKRAQLTVTWPENEAASRAADATVSELVARELTAESAVKIALLNNRNLRAVYQDLGVQEAELVQAGLLPNPVLSADVRFGVGASGTGADLGLVQDVISALQIPLRKRVAGAALEVAKVAAADAVLKLALDTKASFYRVQGALQMLELRRTVVSATAVARDIAERQHEAGNISDLDLASQVAQNEDAKLELASAESAVVSDREELNTLLGLWGELTTWKTAARLPTLPRADVASTGLETLAVFQRLDLEEARLRTGGAMAQYRMGRLYGLIPNASMGAAAQRELDGAWSLGPALDIPIPLFDQRQALLASAAARVRGNQERYAALAVGIRAQVRRAWSGLEAARARAEYFEKVVLPLHARIVEETQRKYNGMFIGVFQLLQAKRDQVDAGRRYVEALSGYWVSRVDLERAVGGELRLEESSPPTTPTPAGEPAMNHQQHHQGG